MAKRGRPKGVKNKPKPVKMTAKEAAPALQLLENANISQSGLAIIRAFTPTELQLLDYIVRNHRECINRDPEWICEKAGVCSATFHRLTSKTEFEQIIIMIIRGKALIAAPAIADDIIEKALAKKPNKFARKTALSLAGILQSAPNFAVNILNAPGGSDRGSDSSDVSKRLKVINARLKHIDDPNPESRAS